MVIAGVVSIGQGHDYCQRLCCVSFVAGDIFLMFTETLILGVVSQILLC
jgi:hypothetical protein